MPSVFFVRSFNIPSSPSFLFSFSSFFFSFLSEHDDCRGNVQLAVLVVGDVCCLCLARMAIVMRVAFRPHSDQIDIFILFFAYTRLSACAFSFSLSLFSSLSLVALVPPSAIQCFRTLNRTSPPLLLTRHIPPSSCFVCVLFLLFLFHIFFLRSSRLVSLSPSARC